VLFLQRLLLLGVIVGSIWRVVYVFFTRSAYFPRAGEAPKPFPHKGQSGSFLIFLLRPTFVLSLGGGMGGVVLVDTC